MRLFFSLILISLFSCGNSAFIHLNEKYKNSNFDTREVSVSIDTTKIEIDNLSDVEDDLVKDGKNSNNLLKVFYDFFVAELESKPRSFSNLEKLYFNNSDAIKNTRHQAYSFPNKKTFHIKTPNKAKNIVFKENETRFILILQELTIRRISAQHPTFDNSAMLAQGGSNAFLRITCYFMLWDNKEKASVSYGYAQGKSSFFFAMSEINWRAASYYLMEDIFNESPFKKPIKKREWR